MTSEQRERLERHLPEPPRYGVEDTFRTSLRAGLKHIDALERQVAELRGELDKVTRVFNQENTRLAGDLDAAREETARVLRLLAYLRPALPVLQSMLKLAGLDGGSAKAQEMLDAIDAALTPTPPQPAARTEEGL
jgi:hypothetical protein